MKNLTILLSIFALCSLFSCEKTELIQPEQNIEAASPEQHVDKKRGNELEATLTTSSVNSTPSNSFPIFNPPAGTPANQEISITQNPANSVSLPIKFPSITEAP